MAKKEITQTLLEKAQAVYTKLLISEGESLSKSDILDILGDEYSSYYTFVVQGLAEIKKVISNRGAGGRVTVNQGIQGLVKELRADNIKSLTKYFKDAPLQVTIAEDPASTPKQEKKLEAEFYKPLQDYLERSGLYEHICINVGLAGTKWENADLAAISFENELKYHPSIGMRLIAFEVKRGFPSIENIQQAAAYLLFAHSSYIVYYDDRFRGTNIDIPVARLRDEGIWDLITTFGLGTIVSYRAQAKGSNLYFQTVREAPAHKPQLLMVEKGVDLWLSTEAKKTVRTVLARQMQKTSSLIE